MCEYSVKQWLYIRFFWRSLHELGLAGTVARSGFRVEFEHRHEHIPKDTYLVMVLHCTVDGGNMAIDLYINNWAGLLSLRVQPRGRSKSIICVLKAARLISVFFVLLINQNAWADLILFNHEVDIRFDAGYMFDDNVTRANVPADKRGDNLYSTSLSGVMMLPLSGHLRGLLTVSVGGEVFERYRGLNRFTESAQGELQYRGSAEFSSPTYGIFLRTFADQYDYGIRSGSRYSAGLNIRIPVTDRIRLFGAVVHNQRYAKSAVFNIMDDSARINLDYALSSKGTIYMGTEMRNGDIVSTGEPTLEKIDISYAFVSDTAFPGGQMFSYRFKGTTLLYTLGYNYGLNSRNALDFTWRMVESRAAERPSYSTTPASYTVNQYSVVYLFSF